MKYGYGKTADGNGNKQLRKDNKEEKKTEDIHHHGSEKTMKVNRH